MELSMVAIDKVRFLDAFDYDTDCVCDVSSRNSSEATNTIRNIITQTSVDLICRHLHTSRSTLQLTTRASFVWSLRNACSSNFELPFPHLPSFNIAAFSFLFGNCYASLQALIA
jgi:hypothetical protein